MQKRKSVLIVLFALVFLTTSLSNIMVFTTPISKAAESQLTPVSYYGEMIVEGNRINGSKTGTPVQVKGMSFFWSNWSGQFWNSGTVDRMVDEFNCEIVRAAYGINDSGTPYNYGDEDKVREVVRAAINRGIYVIIDWHSHGAQHNVAAAKDFFGKMAEEFGSYDNVIFELFNEPLQVPWATVKGYAEQVIPVIRQYSNNLIIVGTPTWSQDVDQAANDPIHADNIAYTLHFYAGTHFQYLRDKGNNAMSKGLALFVTEWGSCNADGDGGINYGSTNEWLAWMDQNKISWCNWAINDKAETSSIFNTSGGLTEAGNYLKDIITGHAGNAEWRNGQAVITSHEIPGRIEAEDYAAMSGIQTETCSEGGSDVGYTNSGDWMDYQVEVKTTGSYNVDFRVASLNGAAGAFQLKDGNNVLCSVDVSDTGDWQNWTTVTTKVNLQAGTRTLRIYSNNSAWNINWMDFKPDVQMPSPTNTSTASPTPSVKLTPTDFIYGDVNGDGNVNAIDFAYMRLKLLGMPIPSQFYILAADVDGSGAFSSIDFAYMRQYLLGIIKKLPADDLIIITPTSIPSTTPIPTPSATPRYDDQRINNLISQMSLQEKVAQLHGEAGAQWMWETASNDRLGIPGFVMSDGPHGVRYGNPATCFPVGSAMAATWDTDLLKRVGIQMGKEFRAHGNNVVLGPCVDIQRDPRNGRSPESPGEDPYLAGKVGSALVRGIQSTQAVAVVKHFAATNHQGNRVNNNHIIDARTLRDLYGLPFRLSVQEGNAWSVMAAYNWINGKPCTENDEILTKMLREEWGFKYYVNSDWWSVYGGVAEAINAGMDLEMPAYGENRYSTQLPNAVNSGQVSMNTLDESVRRVLRTKMAAGLLDNYPAGNPADINSSTAKGLSLETSQKSLVLLKNDNNILPLNQNTIKSIALIGPSADVAQLDGFGSSFVEYPAYTVSPRQGIANRAPGIEINYVKGCDINSSWTGDFQNAKNAAASSDMVIYVGGLDKTQEGEGYGEGGDRKSGSVQLPGQQQNLINELAEANPNLIVVLVSGGITSVESCHSNIRGLVQAFYPGQDGGNAIADLLFGNINPAGRLPVTMPLNDTQLPNWQDFDFTNDVVDGFGYRKFDAENLKPLYAFGHGLSYTTFEYSNLKISSELAPGDATIQVQVDIRNSGDRDGDEVPQLYTSVVYDDHNAVSAIPMPKKQLRGFKRVFIPAGQTKTVTFTLGPDELSFWSVADDSMRVEAGTYTVKIGGASDNLPLSDTFILTSSVLYNSADRTTRPASPLVR